MKPSSKDYKVCKTKKSRVCLSVTDPSWTCVFLLNVSSCNCEWCGSKSRIFTEMWEDSCNSRNLPRRCFLDLIYGRSARCPSCPPWWKFTHRLDSPRWDLPLNKRLRSSCCTHLRDVAVIVLHMWQTARSIIDIWVSTCGLKKKQTQYWYVWMIWNACWL